MTGGGGELARCYYGHGFASSAQAAEAICRHHLYRIPAPIATGAAEELVRRWVRDWVAKRADDGVPLSALGDEFYLAERMGSWGAAGQGIYEHWADPVMPFWTAALRPHMFACPPELRSRDGFHNLVLRELSPALWGVRFAGDAPRWQSLRAANGPSEKVTRTLARSSRVIRKLRSEALRRLDVRGRDQSTWPDPIVELQALARELVVASSNHPAWELLDRARVEQILKADARGMHPRGRALIWRFVTVFEEGTPTARDEITPVAVLEV